MGTSTSEPVSKKRQHQGKTELDNVVEELWIFKTAFDYFYDRNSSMI